MTDLTQPVAWKYRWKIDGEYVGWRYSDASNAHPSLDGFEEIPLYDADSIGTLTPRADAELAVALMVEPLLKRREGIEADIRSAHHGRGDGASSAMREDDRDFRAAVAAAFDALVPASALAELQALRADRDRLDAATNTLSEMWEGEKARAEAAEADITTYQKIVADMTQEAETDKAELATLRAAEKELSDAYLRIREKLGAWNTAHGGADRFAVTEAAVDALREKVERLTGAAEALGAMPEGYCFCSRNRIGDDSKTHEPECADLRAALTEGSAP